MLFFAFSSVAQAQVDDCPQQDCGTNWVTPPPINIQVPGFPGCTIQVHYRELRCLGTTTGVVREIQAWGPIAGNCNAFMATFLPNWPNAPHTINQAALANASQQVMLATAEQLFLNIYNQTPFPQSLECPQFNSAGIIEFQSFSCMSTCITQDRTNPAFALITETPCESDGCCSTIIEHCFDLETNDVLIQETVMSTGDPACQSERPACTIPPNSDLIYQSDCGTNFVCE